MACVLLSDVTSNVTFSSDCSTGVLDAVGDVKQAGEKNKKRLRRSSSFNGCCLDISEQTTINGPQQDFNNKILQAFNNVQLSISESSLKIEALVQHLQIFPTFQASLDTLVARVEKISEEIGMVKQLNERVTAVEQVISIVDKISTENITTLKKHEEDLGQLNKSLNELEERTLSLETKVLINNLLLTGLEEVGRDEDCYSTVNQFLHDHLGIDHELAIEGCYRLGRYHRGQLRPIVVTFLHSYDKNSIRRIAYKLAGKPFGIRDHLPKKVNERRKILLPKLKDLKEKYGRNVFLKNDILTSPEGSWRVDSQGVIVALRAPDEQRPWRSQDQHRQQSSRSQSSQQQQQQQQQTRQQQPHHEQNIQREQQQPQQNQRQQLWQPQQLHQRELLYRSQHIQQELNDQKKQSYQPHQKQLNLQQQRYQHGHDQRQQQRQHQQQEQPQQQQYQLEQQEQQQQAQPLYLQQQQVYPTGPPQHSQQQQQYHQEQYQQQQLMHLQPQHLQHQQHQLPQRQLPQHQQQPYHQQLQLQQQHHQHQQQPQHQQPQHPSHHHQQQIQQQPQYQQQQLHQQYHQQLQQQPQPQLPQLQPQHQQKEQQYQQQQMHQEGGTTSADCVTLTVL